MELIHILEPFVLLCSSIQFLVRMQYFMLSMNPRKENHALSLEMLIQIKFLKVLSKFPISFKSHLQQDVFSVML